ncbi:MAG: hypothetical protein JNL47_11610 [Bacteroidia bacterium]|nr:hypothetical protein [Bacteroidia bacterium]
MMELIIAILIALGSIATPDQFSADFEFENPDAYNEAKSIYESGNYTIERTETGGVVVVTGVGV